MRSARVSVFLAVRSVVRGNYGITALTTLMMLLIYVSLLFLPSLIQGAVNRVNGLLVDTVTSDVVITAAGSASSIDDLDTYLSQIRKTQGVQGATAVYHVGTQISYGSESGSYSVDAIDPSTYSQVFSTPGNIYSGHYLSESSTEQIFVGIGVAGAGQTSIRGYRASLQTVQSNDQVQVGLVNGHTDAFSVVGIYDNQFPLSDNNAYISMSEANQLIPASQDQATAIYVKTDPGADVNTVVHRLQGVRGGMKFETSADLGSVVQDQTASFSLISDILKVISLLMAAITIFIITYIDLVNKRRQIGIQRAIGIRGGSIIASYVLKAWSYALIGVGAGYLLFAYPITAAVQHHPFQFPNGPVTLATTWNEMSGDIVILVIVATIAALIPSVRSVQIRILDAIWGS
ncbi:MAG TPA: ABC transporter permease [Candidatus Dormibacteraeota bacterium]|jgi:putative ABC transport system permease protein|nr:ABC transporter permease [Candidatus Dormibacteraeota bacterium]